METLGKIGKEEFISWERDQMDKAGNKLTKTTVEEIKNVILGKQSNLFRLPAKNDPAPPPPRPGNFAESFFFA